MKIYIDEAGPFVVPKNGAYSISLVSALVIPSALEANLLAAFKNVRNRWTGKADVEVKGSSIDESQAAKIIAVLSHYEVLVEFYAIDMVSHTDSVVDPFKALQAAAITKHLTSQYHPNIVQQLHDLAEATKNTPNQLFIQAMATIKLIFETIQNATLYYVQRRPKELGDIAWIVDRKDHTLTEIEKLWSTLILPFGESDSIKNPIGMLKGADYSHFNARYEIAPDDIEMKNHIEWMREAYGLALESDPGIDEKRLLTEQLSFQDSKDSLGLQLADIVASIIRRAFNRRLKYAGWKDVGSLLVRRKNHSRFLAFGNQSSQVLGGHLARVWRRLDQTSKSMLVE